MTWLAPKLKRRIEIRTATQTPNSSGGFDRGYTTLITIWANVKPVRYNEYIRGVQVGKNITHEMIIRKTSIQNLGKDYNRAFGDGFDSIADLNSLKSDYFVFLKSNGSKGRLFRIDGIENDEMNMEYLKLRAEEIEEQGTGYNA